MISRLIRHLRKRKTQGPDISSPEHKSDPYPFYARLRAENPVHRIMLRGGLSAWLVTRYDDAVRVLRDDQFAKNPDNALTALQVKKQPWVPAMFRPLTRNMLDLDPPDHPRLRGVVQKAFTPQLVEQMRPRIQALADRLLDNLCDRPQIDLIHDYALPIPTTVIADMLGVPPADRYRFHRWSQAIVSATPTGPARFLVIPHVWKFLRFIRRLIQAKRTDPSDDLLSALVLAEDAGDGLSDDELVAMVFLLLVAGHETTVNLIGNGVLALLEHPEQLDRLRREPTLIRSAVEELLRYGSPLETATERFARHDVQVAGVTIPRGGQVYVAIGSANRDERQFPNADLLDITREPNRHLAFGLGPHFCLGAPLARLEGQVAIQTLLRRAPKLGLAVDSTNLQWRRGLVLRGLKSLPLTVDEWA